MNEAERNDYHLHLLSSLFRELGVYLTFTEVVRMIVGDGQVEEMLAKVRSDPDLQGHVDSYMQILAAALSDSVAVDPDTALQTFLAQWNAKGRPN
jgi:hypothetical protein